MTRHRLLLVLLFSLLLGGVAGAAGLWYFFGGSAPAAADLDDAAGAVSSTQPGTPVDANGTWAVDTSIGNFSDYSEHLGRLSRGRGPRQHRRDRGRRPDPGRERHAHARRRLSTAAPDRSRADDQSGATESDAIRRSSGRSKRPNIPTATFELTDPIDLPNTPAEGVTYDISATGNLTLHGVTREVHGRPRGDGS